MSLRPACWTATFHVALAIALAALSGCAAPSSDDAAEGAAAVSTADAAAWAPELAARLDGASLALTRDIRFGAGQTYVMLGFAQETMCELERTAIGAEETLAAGARYELGAVAARPGAPSSSTKGDAIGGVLTEIDPATGARGATAPVALRCVAMDPGAAPTLSGIVAAFAARGGKQVTLTLASSGR